MWMADEKEKSNEEGTQSDEAGFVKVVLESHSLRSHHVLIQWSNINKLAAVDNSNRVKDRDLIPAPSWVNGFSSEGKRCSSWCLQEPGSRTKWLVSALCVSRSRWTMCKRRRVKTLFLLLRLLLQFEEQCPHQVCLVPTHWKIIWINASDASSEPPTRKV